MDKKLTEATTDKLLEQAVSKKLLQGLKVADFGWVATIPITGKYLGDCGAEVIRVEGRTRMDNIRSTPAIFDQWNTSKKSLALNLTHPKAIEVAKKLVTWADVVAENMVTGSMEKMGLGYEDLKKVNPKIIYLGTTLQGRSGPAAYSRGYGTILVALNGITQITGWPDREPAQLATYTDFINPHYILAVLMAALLYRQRTGKGMYIDVSQFEVTLQYMAPLLLEYAVNRRTVFRMGNRSTYASPHGIFRCHGNDRWCAIAVFNEKEWQSFCKVMGNPDWTKDPRFASFLERKKNEDELEKLVEAWTINHTAEEVMTLMQHAGVAAGVAQTGEDLVEHDPQIAAQQFLVKLPQPETGSYLAHRSPFHPTKSPYEMYRAPMLGEHNEYVLKEILGMSDDEIADLVIDGSVE